VLSTPCINSDSDSNEEDRGKNTHTQSWPWTKTDEGGFIARHLFKRQLLSVTDCHIKSDFDRKSSSAQFEGKGTIQWT
jgi:hypothetical protein